jgi:hypothetical protein
MHIHDGFIAVNGPHIVTMDPAARFSVHPRFTKPGATKRKNFDPDFPDIHRPERNRTPGQLDPCLRETQTLDHTETVTTNDEGSRIITPPTAREALLPAQKRTV